MSDIRRFDFEGGPLTTITYKGRIAFIAKEVGERLGYADGGKIPKMIRQEWKDEFEEEVDYTLPKGSDLSDLKAVLEVSTEYGLSFKYAPHVMLLYESGVNAVALLSRKPVARRLRQFIAREVMPQLNRDGRYDPGRSVMEDGTLSELPRTLPDAYRAMSELYLAAAQEAQGRMEEEKKRIEAEAAVEKMTPDARYGKALSLAKGCVNAGEVAKSIYIEGVDLGRNRLLSFLREESRIITGGKEHNLPYQRYVESGLFMVRTGQRLRSDGTYENTKTLGITPKGEKAIVSWIVESKKYSGRIVRYKGRVVNGQIDLFKKRGIK